MREISRYSCHIVKGASSLKFPALSKHWSQTVTCLSYRKALVLTDRLTHLVSLQLLSALFPCERKLLGKSTRMSLKPQLLARLPSISFVRHLDKMQAPWLTGSEYAILETSLKNWYASLHISLQFAQTAISIRKQASEVGGLLLLHITYHQTLCKLNRMGMAKSFQISPSTQFSPQQNGSPLAHVQCECLTNAIAVSAVFEEALKHNFDGLVDTWLSVAAHHSLRIMVHHLQHENSENGRQTPSTKAIWASVLTNLKALRKMMQIQVLAGPLVSRIFQPDTAIAYDCWDPVQIGHQLFREAQLHHFRRTEDLSG